MKCQRVSLSYINCIHRCIPTIVSYTRTHVHYTYHHTSGYIDFLWEMNVSILSLSFIRLYREPYAKLYTGAQNHTNTHKWIHTQPHWATSVQREYKNELQSDWRVENDTVKRYHTLFSTFQFIVNQSSDQFVCPCAPNPLSISLTVVCYFWICGVRCIGLWDWLVVVIFLLLFHLKSILIWFIWFTFE